MPLSKRQRRELESRLSEWQQPKTMRRAVNKVDTETLLVQPGNAFLRDAWVGAGFAEAVRAEAVRLVSGQWPDFEVKSSTGIKQFEVVEADDPDRRRGAEYKKGQPRLQHDPVENWAKRAEAAPGWLRLACEKKLTKRYGSKTNLVIYLPAVGEYGTQYDKVISSFAASTSSAKDQFKSVWVFWKACAYCVWSDGKANADYWKPYAPSPKWLLKESNA